MNNESNYGLNTLTLDKINYLTSGSLSYYGPVIEKNGRYYITTNNNGKFNIIAVLDKSISVEEAQRVTNDIYIKNIRNSETINYGNSGFEPDNIDELDTYITDVESTIGNKIGYINLDDNKVISIYNHDGSKINENTIVKKIDNQYDLSGFNKEPQIMYYGSDKVNDENIKVLNKYIKDISGISDAKIEYDEINKVYVVKSQDKVLLAFGKDATLAEATAAINETFQKKKSLEKLNKNPLTNKLQSKNDSYTVYINVNDYNTVQGKLGSAKSSVSAGSSSYKTGCLSGKLQAQFANLVGDANPKIKLMATENLIDTLKSNINYSINAYENIGSKLGVIINSVIDEIFSMNNYKDKITSEFYATTLEEREKYLDKIINDLSTRITELQDEYKNVVSLIEGVGFAFGLFNEISDSNFDNNRNNIKYGEILDFMFENDIVSKLKSYASGSDWVKSGLADIYNERYASTVIEDQVDLNENNFLSKYLRLQRFESNTRLSVLRSTHFMPIVRIKDFPDDYQTLKNYMLKQVNAFDLESKISLVDDKGNKINLTKQDKVDLYLASIDSYKESIYTASEILYNYNQYKNLMKYEPDATGNLYLEYLSQDWSSYDFSYTDISGKVQYMDQNEIALYCMYSGIPLINKTDSDITNNKVNPELAEEYIEALDDVINRRQGLQEAILRYEGFTSSTAPKALFDAAKYGFSDGVEGFLDGLANVFFADGKRSASDYRNMFLLNFLSDDKDKILGDKYHLDDLDPIYRDLLKKDYSVFKGIGTLIIPTAVSFLPLAGNTASVASKLLYSGFSLGSHAEMAMQSGASGVNAYLYGGVSALSNLALNKLMSGIAGLNGKLPQTGLLNNLTAMGKQAGRATAGVYIDSLWRSLILGQPIDLKATTGMATEQALEGLMVAAALNGITKCTFKVADGFIYKYSDKYNSYQEMLKDMQTQFKNSEKYNKLAVIKKAGGEAWNVERAKYANTMIGKWLDDLDDPNKASLLNLTDQADSILKDGNILGPNEVLIYDNNSRGYYISNTINGNTLRLSPSWISNHEPGPIDNNLNFYYGLGTGNGYYLGDGSDVAPAPMPTPENARPENYMLIRSTDILPQDGIIRYIHQDIDSDNRHTIHFTTNGLVKGGFIGADDWDNKPYIILEPFKYHVDPSLRGGFAGDVYYNDQMKLSNEAIILVKKDWYDTHKDTLPKGYNYRTFSGDPNEVVKETLKSLGYYAADPTIAPAITEREGITKEQVDYEKAFTTMLNNLKEGGMSGITPKLVHSGSQDFQYEKTMNTTTNTLSELRGQTVRLGDKDVVLSNDEVVKILGKVSGTIESPEMFKKAMLDEGIAYDDKTGQFRIVDYNEYMNRAFGRGIVTYNLSDHTASTVKDDEVSAAYKQFRNIATSQDVKLKSIQSALGNNYRLEVAPNGKVLIRPTNAISLIDEDRLDAASLTRKEGKIINDKVVPVTLDINKLFTLDEKEQQSLVEKQIRLQVEKEFDNVMLKRQG